MGLGDNRSRIGGDQGLHNSRPAGERDRRCTDDRQIDIEGSEVGLFRSNVDWVNEAPVIVFESHDSLFNWRGTFHAVVSILTKRPRDYIQSGENTFSFLHSMASMQADLGD